MIDPFWKISNKLYKKQKNRIARLFEVISMIVSSHAVSAKTDVGPDTIFYHHALGCVVLGTTKIGSGCKIFQNVTIGHSFSKTRENTGGYCAIGDNCIIGAGAALIGNITIGNNVTVGANAVVLRDVPDNVVVAGVPAEIKRINV